MGNLTLSIGSGGDNARREREVREGRVREGETVVGGVGGSAEWRKNKLRTELLIKCVIAVRNAAQDRSMAVSGAIGER